MAGGGGEEARVGDEDGEGEPWTERAIACDGAGPDSDSAGGQGGGGAGDESFGRPVEGRSRRAGVAGKREELRVRLWGLLVVFLLARD